MMGDYTYRDPKTEMQKRWRQRVRTTAPDMQPEEVESLTQVLANTRRSSGVNWALVGELRNEIAAGRYRIRGERIAAGMLAEARWMY